MTEHTETLIMVFAATGLGVRRVCCSASASSDGQICAAELSGA